MSDVTTRLLDDYNSSREQVRACAWAVVSALIGRFYASFRNGVSLRAILVLLTRIDCGGCSPVANEVRYAGLMDNSREENDP